MLGSFPVASAPLTSLVSTVATQTIQDSLVLSESVSKRYDRTLTDGLVITDSAVGLKFGGIVLVDYITLQEKLIRNYPTFVDGMFLNETLTVIIVNKTPNMFESIGFSESIKAQRIVSFTIAELLSLSEQARRGLQIQPSDRLNILEIISTIVLKRITIADGLQLRENINITRPTKFIGDGINFTDNIKYNGPVRSSVTEQINRVETVSYRLLRPQIVSDTFNLSEQIEERFTKLTIKEILTLVEVLNINALLGIEFCDKIIFVEKPARVKQQDVGETLTLIDNTRSTNIVDRLLLNEFLLTNAIFASCENSTYLPNKGKSENFSVTDAIKVNIVKKITVTDSLAYKTSLVWR